ncbi:MAG: AI-2E family transporter [Flavobacteriales bacterium]
MEQPSLRLPLYAKLSLVTVGLVASFFILWIGQDIIVPLIFATILAVLMNPAVVWLERRGLGRVLSILIALIVGFALIIALLYFLASQISLFSSSLPQFKEKLGVLWHDTLGWLNTHLHVDEQRVRGWLQRARQQGLDQGGAMLGSTLSTISSLVALLFLLPVYIFMILLYKDLLIRFILMLFGDGHRHAVSEVLMQVRSVVQSYLVGLLVEAAIVAVLNSVGLLLIGVDYAILLGVIGALLNVIPYVGGLVAIALPMLVAFATQTPTAALLVVVVYTVVQFIDNNVVVPRVVAGKVEVNGLASVVVVLIGGALWGVAGMFLSLPLTAILKVIFDRVPELVPFGYVLGEGDDNGKPRGRKTAMRLPARKKR